MKKSKKRNYAIIVLLILLIAIAVGYAAFSSELTINGSASTTANWDVEFTDAKLQTVISNLGNLDAKLTSVNVDTSNLGSEITITPTETPTTGNNGLPIANEILAAKESCTCEFVVQWKPGSTVSSAEGSFTVTFTYDQDAQAITITPEHGAHTKVNP